VAEVELAAFESHRKAGGVAVDRALHLALDLARLLGLRPAERAGDATRMDTRAGRIVM